jgi:Uma2 family endonuclease
MTTQVARRLFTVSEYNLMGKVGILTEDDRVELIRGEIVYMTPIGLPHMACVKRLNSLFIGYLGPNATISVQDAIQLDEQSAPQPDVAILEPRADFYAGVTPSAAHVRLLVEVTDSSLGHDRDDKLPLYALAQIPEAWIVNVVDEIVEVYSQPVNEFYQQSQMVKRGESFTSPALPGLTITAEMILG